MEFTLADESEESKKKEELSSAELSKQLERLIQDKADNQRIFDWIEVCAPVCVQFILFIVFFFYFHVHLVPFTIFTSCFMNDASCV